MELPMQAFCLNGYNGDKISFVINEVPDFPNFTSSEGGYDVIGVLEICAGCYHIAVERYFSATGALYHFCEELQECHKTLQGDAKYGLLWERDLLFAVSMTSRGHAVIKGTYQEYQHVQNILQFEIETDQTCFQSVIDAIEQLKSILGGYQGIKM